MKDYEQLYYDSQYEIKQLKSEIKKLKEKYICMKHLIRKRI